MIFRILLVLMLLVAAPVSSFAGSVVYSYDELDRLHEATYDGYYKITYEYDELGNIKSRTVFPKVGIGSVSFQYGDGKEYYPASNGWYTYWTPPSVGLATIVCNGAGGGGNHDSGDANAGAGGFSAFALTNTILSAAGGSGGTEEMGDGGSGDKGVITNYPLSPVSYTIYVGHGGVNGDANIYHLAYNSDTSFGATALYAGSGGVGGLGGYQGLSGANGSVTISWSPTGGGAPLLITAASISPGASGVQYNQPLTATGGTAPYTWSVVSSSLPPGLILNASSGLISGTPTAAGLHHFTVQVSDSTGVSTAKNYSITITAPSIATTSLVAGNVGTSYSQTLTATGGGLPYAWSIVSGTLPNGLSLNASNGVISGTPTTTGSSSLTVQVRDVFGSTVSRILSMSILPPAAASVTFQYGDGRTYTAAPNGWYTTWTPPYSITATVTCKGAGGGGGSQDDEAYYPYGRNGGYSAIGTSGGISLAQAKGGVGGDIFEAGIAGDKVAATLALSATDYKVYVGRGGSPGGNTAANNYTTGSNSGGAVTPNGGATAGWGAGANGSVTISWAPLPLAITTTALPGGVTGRAYSYTMTAINGVAPYSWSILAGALPGGLVLNATTGTISGTPSTVGDNPLTLKVLDSVGATATVNLSIIVSAPDIDGFISGSVINPIWYFSASSYGVTSTTAVTSAAGHLGNPALDVNVKGTGVYSNHYTLTTNNRNVSSFWYRLANVPSSQAWVQWSDGTGSWVDDGEGYMYWEATFFSKVLTADGVSRQLVLNLPVVSLIIVRSPIPQGSYFDIHDYYDNFLEY